MKGLSAAIGTELTKARHSRVPWGVAAGFTLAPLVLGLFMVILKDPAAAKGFFDGLGPGNSVPYGAWGVLIGAFSFTAMALMVIVRKRWIEQERLSFPMAQLPLSLIMGEAVIASVNEVLYLLLYLLTT